MRHRSNVKRFNRTPAHRRAMLRNVACGLLRTDFDPDDPGAGPGRIVTTPQKAKECRKLVEKLITLAKRGGVANFRRAVGMLGDKELVHKLFKEIAPRYAERNGGYTRILHLSEVRLGDAAPQCIFELVEQEPARKKKRAGKAAKAARKAPKAGKPAAGASSEDKQTKGKGGQPAPQAAPDASDDDNPQ